MERRRGDRRPFPGWNLRLCADVRSGVLEQSEETSEHGSADGMHELGDVAHGHEQMCDGRDTGDWASFEPCHGDEADGDDLRGERRGGDPAGQRPALRS